MKYGKLQEQAFENLGEMRSGTGSTLPEFTVLGAYLQGRRSWREYLKRDLAGVDGIKALLDAHDDDTLHRLMTNLAGNDLDSCLEAFNGIPTTLRPVLSDTRLRDSACRSQGIKTTTPG